MSDSSVQNVLQVLSELCNFHSYQTTELRMGTLLSWGIALSQDRNGLTQVTSNQKNLWLSYYFQSETVLLCCSLDTKLMHNVKNFDIYCIPKIYSK